MAHQTDPQGANFTKITHHDTYPAISPSLSNLSGKSVLITGASKGVGRATALSYAKAGASQIALAARSDLASLEAEIISSAQSAGKPTPQILSLNLDVQNHASVLQAAELVKGAFGGLDVLLNNAGYLETFTPVADSDIDEYWRTWEVNYRGVYWVTRAFIPLLINPAFKNGRTEAGLKTIVNVSSVGAHITRFGASAYQTTKFALLRFTEFLVVEYGTEGLVAFAAHPGSIMTELSSNMPEHTHHLLRDTPEMAADTLVFLTREKRDWLAGRYVSCNWDMPELLSREKEIVEGGKLKMRMVQ